MAPLLLAVVVLLLRHLYYRLHLRLPPGPRPWPVVGNLYQIKSVRFRRFAEWAQSHGPIISVWEGSTLNVVVSTSELARQVLKDNDRHIADRYRSRAAAKLAGSGQGLIWADYGPHYVTARKVTAALLSAKSLESLRPIREDEVTAMVESIYTQCGSRSMQLEKYLRAVAFNNITRMAFGKRGVGRRGDEGYHGGASAEAPSHRRACAVAAVDVPAPRPCTRRACCSEGPPHAADNHRPQPPKRRSKAAFLQHFAHR